MNISQRHAQIATLFARSCGAAEAADYDVQLLGAGRQAAVFLVCGSNGRPVYDDQTRLVLKVFDPRRGHTLEAIRDEWEALGRLHAAVHGRVIEGWTIHAPRPLFLNEPLLALAVTVVPGTTLSSLLVRTPRTQRQIFETLAPTVIAAMQAYWSAEQRLYGDFHLRNLLCDPAHRCLSFVDPGMPEPRWLCPEVDRRWFPASRDLAYLLYYTASAVKLTLGKPALRRQERWFATRLLQAGLDALAAPEDRGSLREEIRACAAAHLARLHPSCSPAGMWRSVVRRITARYMTQVLDSLDLSCGSASSTLRLPTCEEAPV